MRFERFPTADEVSRRVGDLVATVLSAKADARIILPAGNTPIPMLACSGQPSPELRDAFLNAHDDPANERLMDELLLSKFVAPNTGSYLPYPARRARVNAYWSTHRLSEIENEALAPNYD